MRIAKMADASKPALPLPSGFGAVAGYIGGDTPHVWTAADWDKFPGMRKVPIFVRSGNAGAAGGEADGWAALHELYKLGVPKHTIVVYDRETSSDAAGTAAFGAVVQWAGYFVVTYGSKDNLFTHPGLNGYWIADPTGKPHMYDRSGVVATQYLEDDGRGYDESEVKFWVYEGRIKPWRKL